MLWCVQLSAYGGAPLSLLLFITCRALSTTRHVVGLRTLLACVAGLVAWPSMELLELRPDCSSHGFLDCLLHHVAKLRQLELSEPHRIHGVCEQEGGLTAMLDETSRARLLRIQIGVGHRV